MTAIYISALGGTLPYGPRLGTASLSDLIRCFTRLGDARLESSSLVEAKHSRSSRFVRYAWLRRPTDPERLNRLYSIMWQGLLVLPSPMILT